MTGQADNPWTPFDNWLEGWTSYFDRQGNSVSDIISNIAPEQLCHIYARECELYISMMTDQQFLTEARDIVAGAISEGLSGEPQCPWCHGTGEVTTRGRSVCNVPCDCPRHKGDDECPRCKGWKRVWDDTHTSHMGCPDCGGTGISEGLPSEGEEMEDA